MTSVFFGLAWAVYGFLLGGLTPTIFYFLLYTFLSFVSPDSGVYKYTNKYIEPTKVIQICALLGAIFGFFFGITY
ncbi:hypothetical protein NIES3275_33540 [Microchaete diplosiphon NIES-3275]|nr:hypothetical protein HCG51_10660 [Tolypothrix sp. PCC 7910]BAY91331.1 hypothetical protein NIES3275_33540 [Microchaete diplosiphon NIES-3275]